MNTWRTLGTVMVALCLAGCLGSAPTSDERPPEAASESAFTAATLVEGTFAWHSGPGPSMGQAYDSVWMAAQPVFATCTDGGSPSPSNLQLEVLQATPPNATIFEVRVDWDAEDFAGNELVLAYRPSDDAQWTESPYLQRAMVHALSLSNEERGTQGGAPWDMWLCITRQQDGVPAHDGSPNTAYRTGLFAGEVDVSIVATTAHTE